MTILRLIGLASVSLSMLALAEPQRFDELVRQIESGERYFTSLADYQQTLQELQAALPANDVERGHMLDRLRCTLDFVDKPEQGITYSDEKLAAAISRNDYAAQSDYYVCRYYLLSQLGDTPRAEDEAQRSFDAASQSENPLSIAISQSLLGGIASYRGNYADAMQHYINAYQLQRGLGYAPYVNELVLSIASTYRRMGLYQDALDYINQAEQEFTSADEEFRKALILQEKAFSNTELGQYETARQQFERAMSLYQKLREPLWYTSAKVNLVRINNQLQRFDIAAQLAEQASNELQALHSLDISSVNVYRGLLALYQGETLLGVKQPQQALQQLELAERQLSLDANPRYLLLLLKAKAEAHASAGHHSVAYELLQQYIEQNEQQQRNAREQQSNLLRVQFDTARQLEKNQQLRAEKKLVEQHLGSMQLAQRWQYAAITLIALLLLALLGFAWSLKQRNWRLHLLAMTDELTGIANRRHIMMQAEQERVKALHTKDALSFLIIDLDFFKKINDQFGHEAGDIVLQQVSLTLSSLLRSQDHFGRTGGEEFLIVLPDTAQQEAVVIAERLRQAVSAIQFEDSKLPDRLSCSIGVSQYQPQEPLNSSLARADKALYEAKANGRNRVVWHHA